MSAYRGADEDEEALEEEEENDDHEETRWMNKDSLLFLIDCGQSMLEAPANGGDCPLKCALRGASMVYQNKIIAGVDDLVGVVFFNTETMKNDHGFEGVYILQELAVPDAPGVLQLDTLQDLASLGKLVGHAKKTHSLYNVLWNSSMIFSKSAIKVGSKRIFLFTNEDNPNAGDRHAQQQAKSKAKDMADLHIEIELFSMNRAGHKFDMSAFYKDIISVDDDDEDKEHYPAGADKLDQILDQVRKKEFKKRTLARLPFFLTETTEISVRIFNLIADAKKGAFTYMDARSQNAEVKPLTKYMTTETGFIVPAKELQSYIEFGGTRVVFSKEEISELKYAGKPGVMLMGFKPRSAIKRKHFLLAGPFMYPNDSEIKGSSVVFNALIESLIKKDLVAICRFIRTSMATPRFVALFPQREKLGADNTQLSPPGFNVVYLAFNDDLRKLRAEPVQRASDEEIKAARGIVDRLKLKSWAPEEFRNPALQKHYSNLQAIALNQDIPEAEDDTLPQVDGMKARAAADIAKFKELVFPAGYDPEQAVEKKSAAKRKTTDSEGGSSSGGGATRKKVQVDLGEDAVKQMATDGKVEKLTIADLKSFLQSVGIHAKSSEKKDALVERVYKYFH